MVAERETLLEFTVRVVAEPETLTEITAGWSKLVTKPRTCIGFLNTPQKTTKCRKPQKNTDSQKTVYASKVVYATVCLLFFPVGAGTQNKGARQNAVTIPMGGRRA